MARKPFQRISLPENDMDPDSLARHMSDPDPHPVYMKANAQLGVSYPKLFRSAEDFRTMPVTTSAGLFDPSLVYYIGANEVTDDITGQTFSPFHPYSYDGLTMEVSGVQYPVWRDQIASFGDFNSAIRAAILAHANDSDGNPNRVHPTLALKNHTHEASDISGLLLAVRNAVAEGYVSVFSQRTDFNEQPEGRKSILYMGYDSDPYFCGHIYQYNPTTAEWEDKTASGSGGSQIDTSELIENHNSDLNGFSHANLPFAAKSEFETVRGTVERLSESTARGTMGWILDQNGEDGATELNLSTMSWDVVSTTLENLIERITAYPGEEITHFVTVRPGIYSFDSGDDTWRKRRIQFSKEDSAWVPASPDPCVFVRSILGNQNSGGPIYHHRGYIEECILGFEKITFVGSWSFRDSYVVIQNCTLLRDNGNPDYKRHFAGGFHFLRCKTALDKITLVAEAVASYASCVSADNSVVELSRCDFVEMTSSLAEDPQTRAIVLNDNTLFTIDNCKCTGWTIAAIDIRTGSRGTIKNTSVSAVIGVRVTDATVEISGTNSIVGDDAGISADHAYIKTSTSNVTYNRPYFVAQGVYGSGATHPIETAAVLLKNRSFADLTAADMTSRTENADISVCLKVDTMSSAILTKCSLVAEVARYGVQVVSMSQLIVDSATSYRGVSSKYNIEPNALSLDGSRINAPN